MKTKFSFLLPLLTIFTAVRWSPLKQGQQRDQLFNEVS